MGSPQQPTYIIPPPSGPNWKTPLLDRRSGFVGSLQHFPIHSIGQGSQRIPRRHAKLTADVNAAIERMKIDSNEQVQHSRRSVETLQSALDQQQTQAGKP